MNKVLNSCAEYRRHVKVLTRTNVLIDYSMLINILSLFAVF